MRKGALYNVFLLILFIGTGVLISFTPARAITFGSEDTWAANSYELRIAQLDSTTFVIAYEDETSATNGRGKAVVATVSGSDVTFGTPVQFDSVITGFISIAKLDSTRVVIASYDGVSDIGSSVVVGTVSGTSISFGTSVKFNGAAVGDQIGLTALDSSTFVASYRDTGNSNRGTAIVGSVSDTTITLGTEAVFDTNHSLKTAVEMLDSTHVLISYHRNAAASFSVVGTISGTSISYGTPVQFDSAAISDDPDITALSSTAAVIVYSDSDNSDFGTAIIASISGTTVSYGTAAVFASTNADMTRVDLIDSSHVFIAYQDETGSAAGKALIGTVSGTSISFSSADTFESSFVDNRPRTIDIDVINSSTALITYTDGGNSDQGTTVIASFDSTAPTTSTLSPTDGATGVSTTTDLVITFDEAVDAESGGSNDIIIKKSSDDSTIETIDAQSGQVTGSGSTTITINPSVTLAEGTSYYIQIGADAFDDAAGNSFAGISDTTTWNFTTVAAASAPSSSSSSSNSPSAPLDFGTVLLDQRRETKGGNIVVTVLANSRITVSSKIIDPDQVHLVRLRLAGKVYFLVDHDDDTIFTLPLTIALAPGSYPYALTADYGITTRTEYGTVIVAGSTQSASHIPLHLLNQLFRQANDRNPTFEEWSYWASRRNDKESPAALLGAMQWGRINGVD